VTHLTFDRYYRQQLTMPPSLKYLIMGYYYQNINEIPKGVIAYYGSWFNYDYDLFNIKKYKEIAIKNGAFDEHKQSGIELHFGIRYNRTTIITQNVVHITFRDCYDQIQKIPNGVTHINFGD